MDDNSAGNSGSQENTAAARNEEQEQGDAAAQAAQAAKFAVKVKEHEKLSADIFALYANEPELPQIADSLYIPHMCKQEIKETIEASLSRKPDLDALPDGLRKAFRDFYKSSPGLYTQRFTDCLKAFHAHFHENGALEGNADFFRPGGVFEKYITKDSATRENARQCGAHMLICLAKIACDPSRESQKDALCGTPTLIIT